MSEGFGVRITTAQSLEGLETWLKRNCLYPWSIEIDDAMREQVRKTVTVVFQSKIDQQRLFARQKK
jgi:hypothetical protein